MSSPDVIAVFDVDRTLTRWDTLPFFLWEITRPHYFVLNSLVLSPVLLGYASGYLSNDIAKEKVLLQFFRGRRIEEVKRIARVFVTGTIPYLLRSEAVERLRWHQTLNHYTALVSASLECYLTLLGARLEVDKVIGTRLETDGEGCFTGRIAGSNCYGPEKLRRLREALPDSRSGEIYAYGDSAGDRELLDAADHAFFNTFGR